MILFFGILSCPFFLLVSVGFSCHHSGKYRRDRVSPILSPAVLSISLESGLETSSYRTLLGLVKESYTHWSICLLRLLSLFAFFTEERLSCIWHVLNHFCIFWMELQHWLDEPNGWGISLLSAWQLSRFIPNKDTVVRNVSEFCESVSPDLLGHIWDFAALIHAQFSELSFQWCEGDIMSSWEK